MTRHELGALLLGVGLASVALTAWSVASLAFDVARDWWAEAAEERRIRRSERAWRRWHAALPEAEKLAGAQKLLAAAREGMPLTAAQHEAVRYEPCVLGADGQCARWSHNHVEDGAR